MAAETRGCFLCGNQPNHKVFRSMTRLDQEELSAWKRSLAVTLCKLLDLDNTYEVIFQRARFCIKCLEVVLGAEFAINSISRFQRQAGRLRKDVEALLALKYEDIIQQQPGEFTDCQGESIGNIISTIHFALEKENPHSIEIKKEGCESLSPIYSGAFYEDPPSFPPPTPEIVDEVDLDHQFIIPNQTIRRIQRRRNVKTDGEHHIPCPLVVGVKPRKNKKRNKPTVHVQESSPLTSKNMTKKERIIYSRSGRQIKPVVHHEETNVSNDKGDVENSNGEIFHEDFNAEVEDSEPEPLIPVKEPPRKKRNIKEVKHGPEFPCPICKLPLPSTLLMEDHLIQNHKLNYDLKCPICSKGFDDFETLQLQQHEGRHNSELPFTCVLCALNFSDAPRLIRHVQASHEGKTLWCNFEVCLQNFVVFPCVNDMKTHLAEVHGMEDEAIESSLYHCTECQSRYSQLQYLQPHERKHMEKPTVPCPVCDKLFYTTLRMRRHLGNIHTTIQMKPKCAFCELKFDFPENIKMHESLHSNETPFDCVLCDAKLSTTADLRRHVQRTHEILPFKCGEEGCDRSYDTTRKLKKHQDQTHCAEKPYKCPHCPYRAHGKARLKMHMLSHTKEAGFPCPVDGCARRFVYKQAVDKHVLHFHETGDKNLLLCTVCGKGFRDGTKLKLHEVYHANLRAFMCELCSATFKTKKDLLGHVKLHEKQNEIRDATPRKSRLLGIGKVGGDEIVRN